MVKEIHFLEKRTSKFAVSNSSPSQVCTGIEIMHNTEEFVITPLNRNGQPASCRIGIPTEDLDHLILELQKFKIHYDTLVRNKAAREGLKPYEEIISRMEFENGLWVIEVEAKGFSRKFKMKPPYEKGDVVYYSSFLANVDKLK